LFSHEALVEIGKNELESKQRAESRAGPKRGEKPHDVIMNEEWSEGSGRTGGLKKRKPTAKKKRGGKTAAVKKGLAKARKAERATEIGQKQTRNTSEAKRGD